MMRPPRPVSDLAEKLRLACKSDPVVEWVPGRDHWRITMANDRVVMTLDHKMTSGGRWVWGGSTLSIDGVRGPIANSFEHFVRVWKNPEEMVNLAPVPPPVSTPIEEMPLDSMPADIAQAIRYVTEKGDLTSSSVGRSGEHFWAVDFLFPRAFLRVHWSVLSKDPIPSEHLYLIIDGEDKSDLAQGELSKALAVIASTPHPGAAAPANIEGATGAQRDRGVEVRTTHVMRN